MGTSLQSSYYLSTKSPSVSTQSLPLLEILYVVGRKFSVEGSEFFTPFVFQPFALCKKASSKLTLKGAKKWKPKDDRLGL